MTPHRGLRLYGRTWWFTAAISFLWELISMCLLSALHSELSAILTIKLLFCSIRIMQIIAWIASPGWQFISKFYHSTLLACTSLKLAELMLWVWILLRFQFQSPVWIDFFGSLVYNLGLCGIGLYFMITAECRQYMRDLMVVGCAEYIAKTDAISRTATPRSADDALEMGAVPPTRGQSCPEFDESVLHWSQMSPDSLTGKGLWITTTNNERCREIAQMLFDLFSSTDSNCISLVDVSQTCSLFSSLVLGLATASSEYRREIEIDPPFPFDEDLKCFPLRGHSPRRENDNDYILINRLVWEPLQKLQERAAAKHRTAGRITPWNTLASALPRSTLVVHGVCNTKQAETLYETIKRLGVGQYNPIRMVVITSPKLLHHLSDSDRAIMKHVCTLYVADIGTIIYSGKYSSPPMFYESLFLLLLDGIHQIAESEVKRVQRTLAELEVLFENPVNNDGSSTLSVFSKLYKASVARKQLLELLSKSQAISGAQINRRLVKDNSRIAKMLQQLFELSSCVEDISVPQEYIFPITNLTNHILEYGFPVNANLEDPKIFVLRAHRFLSRLAMRFEILPDEIVVNGVTLLSEHPVKHGGFSSVYHGRFKDSNGDDVEVALKVLKIFEDQTDENRRVLNKKFVKEALVWHYARHKNVVPFLGVDFTTFPSPSKAMVSTWMPLESVLSYMGEHSPSSLYAIGLLDDVIQGLVYLHSINVVHGDLCGRNILIDKDGHARLSDFGLAGFIDLQTSVKSSTRSGSSRWMAPELLLPPAGVRFGRTPESDVWAFGCVSCEIWSEGSMPFSQFGTDAGILLVVAQFNDGGVQESPYPDRPHDKGSNPMLNTLWEVAQWCFQYDASKRPAVQIIADSLSKMKGYVAQETIPTSVASGSGASMRATSIQDSTHHVPVPSSSSATSVADKRNRHVQFEEEHATVRFGPIITDDNPEETFWRIFKGLSDIVRKGVLDKPLLVKEHDDGHLMLQFHTLVEANNFAMTWMVYRFDPHLQVKATLVDNE
ncbi:Kinase-like protein [Mycena venus]|uniref:Kinase-like protein n=1 Tax=Mycena venus TaxID=2733690 RepID=A0A8H6X890_9AGAR|nr:Kinase-like protein [Mycena venus]